LSNRSKGRFSTLPQQHSFFVRLSLADIGGAVFASDLSDSLGIDLDAIRQAVYFGK
jgi:hypothetical protein